MPKYREKCVGLHFMKHTLFSSMVSYKVIKGEGGYFGEVTEVTGRGFPGDPWIELDCNHVLTFDTTYSAQ